MYTAINNSPAIFLDNKYTACYLRIMEAAKKNPPEGYGEKHHIWPVKLGGPKTDKNNIVKLTAKAHFVAHHLLIKMLEGEAKRNMCFALSYFRTSCKNHDRKLTASQYEVARKAHSEAMTGKPMSPAHRIVLTASRKGVPLSEEAKIKMGEKLKKQHEFFALIDNDEYIHHHDFYRFCDANDFSRGVIQAALKKEIIYVISCGKHKGKCFSWADVGEEAMKAARELAFARSTEKRSKAAGQAHATEHATSNLRRARRTDIELIDPSGQLHKFDLLTDTGKFGPPVSLQNVKNKLPHTFSHGAWAKWTIIKFCTTVRKPNGNENDA